MEQWIATYKSSWLMIKFKVDILLYLSWTKERWTVRMDKIKSYRRRRMASVERKTCLHQNIWQRRRRSLSVSKHPVLCRVYTRTHVAGYKLYPLVAINMFFLYRRQNCRLSVAGYKGIQVDRDINEQQLCRRDTGYSGRATCICPHTSCSSGIHVSGRHVSWCKRGIWDAICNIKSGTYRICQFAQDYTVKYK